MIVDVDHREYRMPSETITRKPPDENKRLGNWWLEASNHHVHKSLCYVHCISSGSSKRFSSLASGRKFVKPHFFRDCHLRENLRPLRSEYHIVKIHSQFAAFCGGVLVASFWHPRFICGVRPFSPSWFFWQTAFPLFDPPKDGYFWGQILLQDWQDRDQDKGLLMTES